jgi:cell division initiation protein
MSRTPGEIRTVEIQRAKVGGYQRQEVDELLDEIADTLASVMRERDELSARLEAIDSDAAVHRELEDLLRSTIVSAEQAAQEAKAQARRESDLIVKEAHAESRRITREAAAEKRRIEEEMRDIRARFRAALARLESDEQPPPAKDQEPKSAGETVEIGEALESGIRNVVA